MFDAVMELGSLVFGVGTLFLSKNYERRTDSAEVMNYLGQIRELFSKVVFCSEKEKVAYPAG
ncbi:hypothetical protein GYB59_14265 [bacterium]|nr:hypothetical protein [bacterium]